MEVYFSLILALLLTLVLEVPFYFIFNKKSLSYLLTVYSMNIVLNLAMNVLLMFVFKDYYVASLIIMEILVFLSEGFIIFWFKNIRFKGFLISIGANSISLGIGLLFNQFHLFTIFPSGMLIILLSIFIVEFTLVIFYFVKEFKKKGRN
ncbi:MAG TPA: hypothetical protein PKV57_01795 [Bacilli bacterium]|jgi:hypothetical protein|nr:hypothetical protein [Bacilli bacterium]